MTAAPRVARGIDQVLRFFSASSSMSSWGSATIRARTMGPRLGRLFTIRCIGHVLSASDCAPPNPASERMAEQIGAAEQHGHAAD